MLLRFALTEMRVSRVRGNSDLSSFNVSCYLRLEQIDQPVTLATETCLFDLLI